MNRVTITLSLPPAVLTAHDNGHWRTRSRTKTRCREVAAWTAKEHAKHAMKKAEVEIDFYFPDLRRRDALNYAQMCKPYIDGIVDAGIIPDDDWLTLRVGRITGHLDRKRPRVEITLQEVAE